MPTKMPTTAHPHPSHSLPAALHTSRLYPSHAHPDSIHIPHRSWPDPAPIPHRSGLDPPTLRTDPTRVAHSIPQDAAGGAEYREEAANRFIGYQLAHMTFGYLFLLGGLIALATPVIPVILSRLDVIKDDQAIYTGFVDMIKMVLAGVGMLLVPLLTQDVFNRLVFFRHNWIVERAAYAFCERPCGLEPTWDPNQRNINTGETPLLRTEKWRDPIQRIPNTWGSKVVGSDPSPDLEDKGSAASFDLEHKASAASPALAQLQQLTASLHISLDPSLHTSLDPSLHISLDPSLHTSLDPSLHVSLDPSLHTSLDPSLHISPIKG